MFITAGPITKLFAGGGRRRVEDICYERRRAEACVDESARHALANAGGREIVGKKEGEQKGSARGSVHWGCYYATWRTVSSVRYGTRLGDLKENWFLCFPIKHSTHTHSSP